MRVLITGGAGFIGRHTAQGFLADGHEVVILDNLSRKGSAYNLSKLSAAFPTLRFEKTDIRDKQALDRVFQEAGPFDAVIHLAAQVAVTTSVLDPATDFDINATGTFNVLESCRRYSPKSAFLYSSTNKVYGDLAHYGYVETDTRYKVQELPAGVTETVLLDFHSPYGCSKGAADQYVRDYARIYDMKTCVFRQSCIYGEEQFGVEDQGWVAWFGIAVALQKPLTVYGTGKQVRDLLWVEDLVDLYKRSIENIEIMKGQVFNIGGGADNAMSLLELITDLQEHAQRKITYNVADWRPGDQKYFVADTSLITKSLGWQPTTPVNVGVSKLLAWIDKSKDQIIEVSR